MDKIFLLAARKWIFPPPPFFAKGAGNGSTVERPVGESSSSVPESLSSVAKSSSSVAESSSPVPGEVSGVNEASGEARVEEEGSLETSDGIERKAPEDVKPVVDSGGRLKRKRSVRQTDPVKEEEVVEELTPPSQPVLWEEETRNALGMGKEEFSHFMESQGFTEKSPVLHELFDFGTADPVGMPRFATKIPEKYYEHSNALRVYRNALRASAIEGDIIINSCDQALGAPDLGSQDLPVEEREGKLDPEEMVVSVDCYHPSSYVRNKLTTDLKMSKLPLLALTVDILASQTLNDLKSKLHCENDFVYICPIKEPKDIAKLDWKKFSGVHDDATTCSSAIFINDTVYTAEVTPNYGQVLRNWEGQKLLGSKEKFKCGTLNTKIKDIPVRPGYPYLYRHSDCEHLLVFTNVRKPHPHDPNVPKLYPRLTYFHNLPSIRCRANPKHLAKFVVKDDRRLPEKMVPLCKECCLTFCYTKDINSKQLPFGEFKLFPLVQMQTLPVNIGNN